MAETECFDIYNEHMVKIGVETRKEAHKKGLWHQTFHCWVVQKSSESTKILLQLRHADKDTFPNMLDISAAGHLLTGETIEDGVRELEEELGISAKFEDLQYCGVVPQQNMISSNFTDREFNHVFIYESNLPLEQYKYQIEEISALYFVEYTDFKNLVLGEVEQVTIEGFILDQDTQQNKYSKRNIKISDLTPNSDEYYQLLFRYL